MLFFREMVQRSKFFIFPSFFSFLFSFPFPFPFPFPFSVSFLFLSLLWMGGCSSLETNCLGMNWYELGRQASTQGTKWSKGFKKINQSCSMTEAEKSIAVRTYKNGFDSGLREFCNFKTGYTYGFSNSQKKSQVCAAAPQTQFVEGYNAGLYMFKIDELQNQIKTKLNQLEKKLGQNESQSKVSSESQSEVGSESRFKVGSEPQRNLTTQGD